jgi:hypothetical protein
MPFKSCYTAVWNISGLEQGLHERKERISNFGWSVFIRTYILTLRQINFQTLTLENDFLAGNDCHLCMFPDPSPLSRGRRSRAGPNNDEGVKSRHSRLSGIVVVHNILIKDDSGQAGMTSKEGCPTFCESINNGWYFSPRCSRMKRSALHESEACYISREQLSSRGHEPVFFDRDYKNIA